MGITGLHGLLKSIQKPCNVKKFAGQTLGVDAYGWLHRGTAACAYEIALGRPTTKYVDFTIGRLRMLQHYGITPYIVFDGGMLPSKEAIEASRAARREESRKLGEEHMRRGRTAEAYQEFQKAVDVTPYMARVLIEELKKHKIKYLVAPYEADPQLVYLEKQGIINGIISEDSDMLVFGAKRLLSKLDKNGDCIEINRGDFAACRDISLIGWTDENFRHMCILSGCDYLTNIPRMGLKTAYRSIRKHKSVDRVVKMVQFDGSSRVPPGYLESFKRAELTFLHQRVFCPTAKCLVMLNPLPDGGNGEDMPFVGAILDPDVAIAIACGDLDPMTKEPIEIKPSYPERERLVRTGRQSITSSDEKKPAREIHEFFTPKRVPLSELDPNSMTPSPGPNRPLVSRQNRYSLAANRVSTPPSITRSAASIPNTPTDRARRTEAFLRSASELPPPQVQKRQRLCSDSDEESVAGNMAEVSRFFAGPGETTTTRKDTTSKKRKSSKLHVFSDQEAALSPGQAITKQHTATNDPTKPLPSGRPLPPLFLEEPISNTSTQESAVTLPTPSLPTVADSRSVDANSDPSLFESVLDYNVKRHNLKLREKYAFNPSEQSETAQSNRDDIPTAPTRSSLPGRCVKRTLSSQIRPSPLQRLKQSALARSKSMTSLQPRKLVDKPEDTPTATADEAADHLLPPRNVSHGGSEDMITPNSDNSADEKDDSQEVAYSFDFSQYAFKKA
ncbi:Rad2 nuclease [Microsporum canis]|uniref:Exodeoxyribonuclease 1 n=1 Tax=Arthroderma otae (strain ATCC MYA-4605 / CBS 113480) TaxID=554155 RepID=C5G077_ARTOC|nr:exodeoxyribonuclease 1 [Microsporum canis CBS 113480]EEQ35530.1 exodeoxyribonuclease 1 [Microsporum canis CBS 113480]